MLVSGPLPLVNQRAGRHPAAAHGAEQAVAREVARNFVARDAARGAASGQQVGQRRAVLAQHAAVVVDVQAALGVEQRAGDLHCVKGRLQGALEASAERVGAARINGRQRLAQHGRITTDKPGQILFGGSYLGIPSTIDGVMSIAGVSVPYQRVLILVVAVIMLVFTWLVLYHTRLGLAIRATANDLEVANLMGMNVHRVAMATLALSVGLAAVAGVVVAPVFVVDPRMWLAPLVTMLAIVVLGGLGSLKGSLIGALVLGYIEAITVFALPAGAYLKGAVALAIMVVVLLVRPEGLFGVAFEEER